MEVARKTIIVSDLTGQEIEAKEAAKVTITYADARRGQVVLDVNANEVEELASKGTRQARRGRRPKAVSGQVRGHEHRQGRARIRRLEDGEARWQPAQGQGGDRERRRW